MADYLDMTLLVSEALEHSLKDFFAVHDDERQGRAGIAGTVDRLSTAKGIIVHGCSLKFRKVSWTCSGKFSQLPKKSPKNGLKGNYERFFGYIPNTNSENLNHTHCSQCD